MTAELNDKSSFSTLCESLGVLVPKSSPITSKELLYELNKECAQISLLDHPHDLPSGLRLLSHACKSEVTLLLHLFMWTAGNHMQRMSPKLLISVHFANRVTGAGRSREGGAGAYEG